MLITDKYDKREEGSQESFNDVSLLEYIVLASVLRLGEQGYNIAEDGERLSEANGQYTHCWREWGSGTQEILPCSVVVGLQHETIDRRRGERRKCRAYRFGKSRETTARKGGDFLCEVGRAKSRHLLFYPIIH